jgi:hypothetical protein
MPNAHGGCLGVDRARKVVARHERLRGGARSRRSSGDRIGQPAAGRTGGTPAPAGAGEPAGELKHLSTRRPKVTTRPGVAASETGTGPNGRVQTTPEGAGRGRVVGPRGERPLALRRARPPSRTRWKP